MTCREKLKELRMDLDDHLLNHTIEHSCPVHHSIAPDPEYCDCGNDDSTCEKCWNREVGPCEDCLFKDDPNRCGICMNRKDAEPMQLATETTEAPKILDSGNRREFETGAVRDIQEGKGRCDLMPLSVVGDYLADDVIDLIAVFQKTGNTAELHEVIHNFRRMGYYRDAYTMFLEVAKHFEEGAKKYGEHNWQKGIPVRCYIDSAVRHYLKFKRGDVDEPHDRAFIWNLLCAIWTCENKPELNDYAKGKDE